MKRPVVNALLDLSAALLVVGMLATGLVLQFVLPAGSGRSWVVWSLARHDWAAVHAYLSAALVGVLVAHVWLHWRWVVEIVGKRLGGRRMSSGALAAAVVAGLVVFFLAFASAAYLSRVPRTDLSECGAASPSPQSSTLAVSYEREVAPLLARRCVRCHNAKDPRAGVRLDDYEAARSCALPTSAGQPSQLLAVLRAGHDSAHELDAANLDLLDRWVCAGAPR